MCSEWRGRFASANGSYRPGAAYRGSHPIRMANAASAPVQWQLSGQLVAYVTDSTRPEAEVVDLA